ncbi:MAG: GDP-mannose 4,6-dehydratase [Candidatus Brocadiaceae bacterium]|nr:GDP-mannose 4,6-dehydratase [Candidatus Brocadiaceae bacterium]
MHTKNLKKFTVFPDQKLSEILKIINIVGVAFVVEENEKLIGIITDGDIRRAAIKGYSLETEAKKVMNHDYFYVIEGTSDQEILAKMPKQVFCFPVVDNDGRILGYRFFTELTKKNALITGITGQDGAYLAEFLLSKGYTVYGGYRRTSNIDFSRLDYLNVKDRIQLIQLDVTDISSVYHALQVSSPAEIYNLAAQSFVETSFNQPCLSLNVNTLGTTNLLAAVKEFCPSAKFYQASTSELYGKVVEIPQNENTPFYPRSPYAISKLAAYWMAVNYREAYGIYACNGILFNHESPIRGQEFVTRKITMGVAKIKLGLADSLLLGNLSAKRDWGYARDFVQSMWLMLQQPEPEDFVIATGISTTVREFAQKAFAIVGLDYNDYVRMDARYFRPSEVDVLVGDPAKAREKLGWNPGCTPLEKLIEMMVLSDLKQLESKL